MKDVVIQYYTETTINVNHNLDESRTLDPQEIPVKRKIPVIYETLKIVTPYLIPRGSRGWGVRVPKAKAFKDKYGATLEFPDGWEMQVKKQCLAGGWGI